MKYFIVICVLLIYITATCSAENNQTIGNITNQTISNTSAPVEDIKPIYPYQPPYRLSSQGQKVYINDTLDITGFGWGTGIAYYGRNGAYEYPIYILQFTNYRSSLYNFYIDPSVFSERPGMWYQYYGNTTETHGNLEMFDVINEYRTETTRYQNGTLINQSIGINNNVSKSMRLELPLSEVYISDYNLAVGDPLFINTDGAAKVWIFGLTDYIYDYETKNDNLTIPSINTSGLTPGNYDILIQKTGDNKEFDVRYIDHNIEYKTGWDGIKSVDINGIQPRVAIGRLQEIISKTDDQYTIQHLVVATPTISITRMDETGLGLKEIEYKDQPGLVSLFDVRGYTNLENGTLLTASLDKPLRGINKNKYTTKALRTAYGNQSAYQVYVPIIWDNMKIGSHTITVESPDGTITYSDFYVGSLREGAPKPNVSLKYADSRNPFIPTPTPEIIRVVETKEVIKETVKEIVREIPANATIIYEQQKRANDETEQERSNTRILYVIFGVLIIVALIVGYYLLTVFRRL